MAMYHVVGRVECAELRYAGFDAMQRAVPTFTYIGPSYRTRTRTEYLVEVGDDALWLAIYDRAPRAPARTAFFRHLRHNTARRDAVLAAKRLGGVVAGRIAILGAFDDWEAEGGA